MINPQQKKSQGWFKGLVLNYLPGMITCEEFENFIVGYFENDLSRKQKIVFETHLRMCRECRDYLTAYQRTMEISRVACETNDDAIPVDVPEDLIKAILDARNH